MGRITRKDYISATRKMLKIQDLIDTKKFPSTIRPTDKEREIIRKLDENLLAKYDDAVLWRRGDNPSMKKYYRNKDIDKYRGKKNERYVSSLQRQNAKARKLHNIDGKIVPESDLTPEDKQYLSEKYKRKKFVRSE